MRLGILVLSFIIWPAAADILFPASTIYGEDDRQMVGPAVPREISMVARSVSALFLKQDISFSRGHMWRASQTVGEAYEMCRTERFFDYPSSAECTGFLITPTRIATAGHCLKSPVRCEDIVWAFDYRQGNYSWDGRRIGIPQSKTYRCKKILAKHNNRFLDLAVIELDRPVEDRWPLKLGDSGRLKGGDEIFSLGFPQGIPMVWSSVGQIRRHEGRLKVFAQIEMSEGNSGSPIFSQESYDVLGVLIEGEMDMRRNRKKACEQSVPCGEKGCFGEVFLSADVLKPFVQESL